MRPLKTGLAICSALLLIASCSDNASSGMGSESTDQNAAVTASQTAMINDERVINADPDSWLSYGRDFKEQRFSPLDQINTTSVGEMGLEFELDLESNGALEATPIMVDGVLYFSAPFSIVHAVDAQTGAKIWTYDPQVPRAYMRRACCGPINRGVAVYEGNVYVATLDGRLVAISASEGTKVWEVDTIIDRTKNYSSTGAPRAARGKIFIGNGGAEFGVRGYVTAYDAANGDEVWRFFTVPGDPSQPFEHPEMELAAETWKGGEWWKAGGGGTVWNSIVYDPELNTLYLGVGNGSPWSRLIRSPGGGDNLFLTCIVAVDADTGEMKWYYQTVPGDNWDYTAVQDMTLADLEIDGKARKVIMQAPKNGFFYVLDRTNGELLRAHPYVQTTWASHVDMETGRPVENLEMDFSERPKWILPGPLGGHDWQAMAFDEKKGIMYLPTQDVPFLYSLDPGFKETGFYKRNPTLTNMGTDEANASFLAAKYADEEPMSQGNLKAFDPLTGEEVWSVEHPFYWNGGVLATAGNLVFQGDAMGYFSAYHADTGEKLWTHNNYVTMLAPPITYSIDGKQYVAILAGAGATIVNFFGNKGVDLPPLKYGNFGKLFVYSLDGAAEVTRPVELDRSIPEQPALTASADELIRGEQFYHRICGSCHGGGAISSGVIPDLRMMSSAKHELFEQIVVGGILSGTGMASFADVLSPKDAEMIRQYVITQANKAREENDTATASAAGR
jgi:quinohemoprotein ethanol dehydrogenase